MPFRSIPCTLMRGGTSKGPYFRLADLPDDPATRDRVLLAVMGSPDRRQIDGIGGADTLTSKVAMVGPSTHPRAQVDYLFAQVSVEQAIVDTAPSCGNMLAGIGPFAIENGMVPAEASETRVMIFNVNTSSLIEATVQTPGGEVEYEGDASIDGVPGTAAPILLGFMDVVGSKTGALLPTGQAIDLIEGVEVTCIDVAMPMVIMRAADLGKTGYEGKAELDSDAAFFARIETIRRIAGERMGLGDVADKVVPKVGLLAPPREGGNVTSRYFVPHRLHAAHAVTGAACVASACVLRGSVADGIARVARSGNETIRIEHPSGKIDVRLESHGDGPGIHIVRAGILRTARKLFSGNVHVPASLWRHS
jgi:4-oxalomesaconate tautomerase